MHFSLVRELGRRTLPEGATLTCIVVARDRGRQARRIIDLDLTTAVGPDPETAAARAADRVNPQAMLAAAGPFEPALVKWFNRLKGYGSWCGRVRPKISSSTWKPCAGPGWPNCSLARRWKCGWHLGTRGPLAVAAQAANTPE